MENSTLSAGDSIEGRCTKCRKNTVHTIVTMVEEGPGDVQCGNCDRQHKFRPPTVAKKTVNRRLANQNDSERKEWEDLRPRMKDKEAVAYSMTGEYKVKALINHPIFGLGMVQRVVGAQKVEVLFEDGKKTMRCG